MYSKPRYCGRIIHNQVGNVIKAHGIRHADSRRKREIDICGRLESRYQYSAGIVYNNFPWPQAETAKQRRAIEAAARAVLDARAKYPDSSLADPPRQALYFLVVVYRNSAKRRGGCESPRQLQLASRSSGCSSPSRADRGSNF